MKVVSQLTRRGNHRSSSIRKGTAKHAFVSTIPKLFAVTTRELYFILEMNQVKTNSTKLQGFIGATKQ